MKLGLKVNADPDGFMRLQDGNPPFVEVWFNVNDEDRYTDLFAELTRRKCEVGLHFWGMCDDNTAPNLAYPDSAVISQTQALMRKTIDIAEKNEFAYVNVHPGASALSKVNYAKERYEPFGEPVDMDRAINTFLENAQELARYAAGKNVVFTVETVPPRITAGWYDAATRLVPHTIHELPDSAIIRAAKLELWVANDVVHTGANTISNDPNAVWSHLLETTKILAPQTRLIHLGFVIPPYNGTDHHGSLDDPTFETSQAIPNKFQTIELLKQFMNRDDVWVLVEPNRDHVKNYRLARKLIEIASQNAS